MCMWNGERRVQMPLKMPKKIKSERIILEAAYPPSVALATEIVEKAKPSYGTLRQWLPWPDKIKRPEDEYNYLVNWAKRHWEEGSGYTYIVRDKNTKAFAGLIDFFKYDDKSKTSEIGYWLIDEAVGHGYITEAVRVIEKTVFEQGVNRIQIRMDTRNKRSEMVAIRCNYQLDGTIRAADWAEYFQDYRDEYVYSKLKSDWKKEQHIVSRNVKGKMKVKRIIKQREYS